MALKTDNGVKIKVIQGYARFETEHRLFVDTSRQQRRPSRARRSPATQPKGETHHLRLRGDRHRRAALRAADSRRARGIAKAVAC